MTELERLKINMNMTESLIKCMKVEGWDLILATQLEEMAEIAIAAAKEIRTCH